MAGFDTAAVLLGIDPRINPDLIRMVNQKQACLPGRDLVLAGVQKVIVDHEGITMQVKIPALSAFIAEQLRIGMPQTPDEIREIKIPYITRRAHKGSIMIEADKGGADKAPCKLKSIYL